MNTIGYIVSYGETAESIARKYNTDLKTLRQLNRKTVFLKNFDHLQKGDVLQVPQTLSSGEPERASALSGYAYQVGTVLTNGDRLKNTQSMATHFLVGKADSSIEQWLNKYGTARVHLNVDDNFSLKNSQFDMLLPLWDNESKLFFAQGSLHRSDGRSQSNLGLGMRYWPGNFMIGSNIFWDYDISRSHSRMGIGLEYWQDYLKLSANGYFRLSNWRNSSDIEDYDKRPANGWDIRTAGYLPSHPQFGFKFNYEKYYGDEVALFGKDNRRRNPYAATFGINYTPFPLITFNVDYKRGAEGDHNTRFGTQLTYRFGVPLAQQLDPDAVNGMRTVAGNRYDFVDRNNNIILEYRKQEVIRLYMAESISGFPDENYSLGAYVKTKYGVTQIDWATPALLAAGGSVTAGANLTDYSVTLPPYRAGGTENNTYLITASATDKKGNVSKQVTTRVNVKAPVIENATSTFQPQESKLTADGKSSVTLTLTTRDSQNLPADINAADINLSVNGQKSAKISKFTRSAPGVYKLTITAETNEETITLTPSTGNLTLPSAEVIILAGAPSGDSSSFTAAPATINADNSATSTLTLTAKDAYGNPVGASAARITFAVTDSKGAPPSASEITVSAVTETATKGTYTATLKGTRADTYTITPNYDGTQIGSRSADVTLSADLATAVITDLKLQGDETVKTTNGTEHFDYVATVKDKQGNLVPNATVSWFKDRKTADFSALTSKTDANGQASLSLTSTNEEGATDIQVSEKVNADTAQVKADKTVNFVGYKFVLDTSKEVIAVNGTSQFNLTAIPSDGSENIVLNDITKWSVSDTSVAKSLSSGLIKGKSQGTVDITASSAYKGISYERKNRLSVKAPVLSPVYGDGAGGLLELEEHIIQPPSYQLATRCGYIVDAIGTEEGISGGSGGDEKTIDDMNKVSEIVTYWGKYQHAQGTIIGKIEFHYSDNHAVQSCGRNQDMSNLTYETYTIPAGMVLQGVRVYAPKYAHAAQWITIDSNVKHIEPFHS